MNGELEPPVAPEEAVDALLKAEADAAIAGADLPAGELGQDAPPPASKETADMCTMLLQVSFNELVAPRCGDHWRLNEGECRALGDAYGALLDKYFPNLRSGPEAAAVVVTLAVLGPRVVIHAKATADEQREEPAAAVGVEATH